MANLGVIGLGKLGACLAAVLADAGHKVIGIDPFAPRAVRAINEGRAPIQEPGLDRLMVGLPKGQLVAWDSGIGYRTDATFVVVPTPSDSDGRFDASAVLDVVRDIGPVVESGHILVIGSTVMPGTIDREVFAALNRDDVQVVYSPMFVALGSVITNMHNPDMVLIGTTGEHERVEEILAPVFQNKPHIARLSIIDAEIAKITLNAMVVSKIGWANTIAEACENTGGADAYAVLGAVGFDRRIGPNYLQPGSPAAGPCFPRDSIAMRRFLEDCLAPDWLPVAGNLINDHQARRIAGMFYDFERVAILGLSYKPNTSVTEKSLGLQVALLLMEEGHDVLVHDPIAKSIEVRMVATIEEAIANAEAVLVAADWDEYRGLDTGDRFTVDVWGILKRRSHVRVIGQFWGGDVQ